MQSKQWEDPGLLPPKKYKRVYSAGKVMALFFWDNQGVIMVNYLEQSHSINNAYYADEFIQLCQEIARK